MMYSAYELNKQGDDTYVYYYYIRYLISIAITVRLLFPQL